MQLWSESTRYFFDNPVNPDFGLRTPGSGRWSGSSPKFIPLIPRPCPTLPRNFVQIRSQLFQLWNRPKWKQPPERNLCPAHKKLESPLKYRRINERVVGRWRMLTWKVHDELLDGAKQSAPYGTQIVCDMKWHSLNAIVFFSLLQMAHHYSGDEMRSFRYWIQQPKSSLMHRRPRRDTR